jgi:hypothetical protein
MIIIMAENVKTKHSLCKIMTIRHQPCPKPKNVSLKKYALFSYSLTLKAYLFVALLTAYLLNKRKLS